MPPIEGEVCPGEIHKFLITSNTTFYGETTESVKQVSGFIMVLTKPQILWSIYYEENGYNR